MSDKFTRKLSKQQEQEKFIEDEIQRLAQLKEDEEEEKRKNEKKNFLSTLEQDMDGEGNFLTPYEAMLHARRISKQLNVDDSLLIKSLQTKSPGMSSDARSPVSVSKKADKISSHVKSNKVISSPDSFYSDPDSNQY